MRIRPMAVLALGFLCGACESGQDSPTALSATAFSAAPERPFTADLHGVANFDFTARVEGRCRTQDVPFLTVNSGKGVASHLGRITWTSSHCTEMPAAPPPPFFVFERGHWIFVAADGDELYVDYTGEQPDPLNPAAPGPMILLTHGTIMGGTGRFADATGWVEMTGIVTLPAAGLEAPDWPVHFRVEGRIRY